MKNFEKWMKKRGNNKLNAYAKNPYHVSWFNRLPKWSKILAPAALAATAAAVVLTIGLSNILPRGTNKSNDAYSYSSARNQEASNNSKPTMSSQQSPASESGSKGGPTDAGLNTSFTYQEITYSYSNKYGSPIIESQYINSFVANINTQDVGTINVYSIKNIDQEVALAVRAQLPTRTIYYVYYNLDCHFHDIGDFVELLPFTEMNITSVQSIDYTGVDFEAATINKYTNYQDTAIFMTLFEDQTIEGYTADDYDYESSTEYFLMNLKVPALGVNSFTARFFSSGYIVYNMFEQNHIFNLGQTRYQTLKNYFTNNTVVTPVH